MHSEKERIEKILAGDLDAFRGLVDDYQRLVSHMVFRLVLNETDREELCQEVFIKVYQNLGRFEFKSRLSTWIARISYNTSLNYLKKNKLSLYDDLTNRPVEGTSQQAGSYADRVAGAGERADDKMVAGERQQLVRDHIDGLPPNYRAVLTLYHMEELSYGEIGEIMNLPDGTVKSYLFRGRKLLKERLMASRSAAELGIVASADKRIAGGL